MKHFANLVLILAGFACLAVLGFLLMRGGTFLADAPGESGLSGSIAFLGLPAAGTALCFGALALRAEWRGLLAACLIAALVSVYGAELYLTYAADDPGEAASAARGLNHDSRSKLDVLRDLRTYGITAYPFVHPALLLAPGGDGQSHSVIRIDGAEVQPVGGIGRVVTVVCREVGAYLIYTADRHGFHNPPDAWPTAGGMADILAIGDSFAQGQCVPDGQGMISRLRETVPATVSLGAGHDGPLLMLAALREFGDRLRPPVVLWLFYEGNDLIIDLPRERRSPLLMQYLAPSFGQNLANRQGPIDEALSAYADEQLIATAAEERDAVRRRLLGIAKLHGLRQLLGATTSPPEPDLALFERVLARARDDVHGWGGRMVFAYLPSWNTLFRPTASLDRMREDVLDIAHRLDLPVVDLLPAFDQAADRHALFYYPGSHYSPEGHALAAHEIGEALEAGEAGDRLR
ncbi:MAG: hypothetical protein O3A96_02065 [Proteobacteria bacterium]|nr:hypothetical protein [Pseudomonadota bacterium]